MTRGMAAGLLLAAGTCPAAAATVGQDLSGACFSCHRGDAQAAEIPPIVGRDRAVLVAGMLAYRSGERRNQIMEVVAHALSAEEIAAVAAYLASLPATGEPP